MTAPASRNHTTSVSTSHPGLCPLACGPATSMSERSLCESNSIDRKDYESTAQFSIAASVAVIQARVRPLVDAHNAAWWADPTAWNMHDSNDGLGRSLNRKRLTQCILLPVSGSILTLFRLSTALRVTIKQVLSWFSPLLPSSSLLLLHLTTFSLTSQGVALCDNAARGVFIVHPVVCCSVGGSSKLSFFQIVASFRSK